MTIGFALLAVGAAALISALTSLTVGAVWGAARLRPIRLAPAAESRLVLTAALLPAFVALLAFAAAMAPWTADHCASHGGHPHLCLVHHEGSWPTAPLVLLALAFLARLALAAYRASAGIWRSRTTRRALDAAASPAEAGVRQLASDAPQAFVVGIIRPTIYASRGLFEAGADTAEPVLAHERAHVRRRDPLRRLIASLGLAFHLPGVASLLERRLARSQELAADADAARATGDPARVAEALLRLTRLRVSQPAVALSFAGGGLDERIQCLLETDPRSLAPGRKALCTAALVLAALAGLGADPVHHGIETLVGLFGG